MADTFTPNKGMIQPATGAYNDSWGPVLNDQVFAVADTAFGGSTTINVTGITGPVILTLSQYQPPNIIFTGTTTVDITYALPPGVGGLWTVYNNTAGGFAVVFGILSSGVAIPQGERVFVVSDGTTISVAQTAATGADPTALVGLTSVHGSADTWMRSDGAPALDQSISPTWTGSHTFQDPLVIHAGGFLTNTLTVNSGGVINATAGGLECATAPSGTANQVAASTAFVAAGFAPLISAALSGVPSAPTAAVGTDTTQLATTAFAYGTLVVSGNNGHFILPNGIIVQFGINTFSSGGTGLTFSSTAGNIAFPNNAFMAVGNSYGGAATSYVTSVDQTVLTAVNGANGQISWIAIGN
jgi:hypothetical protein